MSTSVRLKTEARGLALGFEFDLPDLPTWPLLAKSGDGMKFKIGTASR